MKANSSEVVSQKVTISILIGLAFVMVGLLLIPWAPTPIQAGPVSDLPSREPPPPPPSGGDSGNGGPAVAYIQLNVQPAKQGLWAVVQWQDTRGGWHDVEGWQGSVDSGAQVWGVFPSEFGKGPFRWSIYGGPKGSLLKSSASFNMPAWSRQVVNVSVTL